MPARIYQPAKTAMQSGRAGTRKWVLEFEPQAPKELDPLMGWTSSADTGQQVRLHFGTKEEAIAYAERQGFDYTVQAPRVRKARPKNYVDNFRWDRIG